MATFQMNLGWLVLVILDFIGAQGDENGVDCRRYKICKAESVSF